MTSKAEDEVLELAKKIARPGYQAFIDAEVWADHIDMVGTRYPSGQLQDSVTTMRVMAKRNEWFPGGEGHKESARIDEYARLRALRGEAFRHKVRNLITSKRVLDDLADWGGWGTLKNYYDTANDGRLWIIDAEHEINWVNFAIFVRKNDDGSEEVKASFEVIVDNTLLSTDQATELSRLFRAVQSKDSKLKLNPQESAAYIANLLKKMPA